MNARAQISMSDLLLASILFFLIVAGLLSYLDNLQTSSYGTIDRRTLDAHTANAAEFIIKNAGTPAHWEDLGSVDAIQTLGLATRDRVLDPDKVVAFINYANTDYTEIQTLLRTGGFDFYVTFEGGISLTGGIPPPATAHASLVRRLVTINGTETTMSLTFYAI